MTDTDRTAPASPQAIVAGLAADSRRIETPCGDGTMVWRRWGKGPPILLLHGAHGSWKHWIRNIAHLARTRTVWAPDIPGFGASCLPSTTPTTGEIATILDKGLTAVSVTVPLDVAGFSFGATVAAHLAALAPHRVRRLVLVDSGGLGTPMAPVRTVSLRHRDGAMAAHRHNLRAMMIHDPAKVDDLALYVQAIDVPRARLDVRDMVLPDRLAQVLARVTAPVDAIWGERDQPHPDPDTQLAALRRVKPDARMRVVPDAGHWSVYEKSASFHVHLDELLATAA